jgi:hypothetical protein
VIHSQWGRLHVSGPTLRTPLLLWHCNPTATAEHKQWQQALNSRKPVVIPRIGRFNCFSGGRIMHRDFFRGQLRPSLSFLLVTLVAGTFIEPPAQSLAEE